MIFYTILLLFTVTSTALITGLFYGYSCSVIEGLGQLNNFQYLEAIQSINIVIQNPLFFASFLGTLVLQPLCTFVAYKKVSTTKFILLFIATICYLIGSFGVTVFGNIPLNEVLGSIHLKSATVESQAALRLQFEGPWNRLHYIRTISSVTSLVFCILACLLPVKPQP